MRRARTYTAGLAGKAAVVSVSVLMTMIVIEIGLRTVGVFISVDEAPVILYDDEVRILVLGESTSAPEVTTWPVLLEHELNTRIDSRKFRVINRAVPGTTTAFIAARLRNQLNSVQPHIVISMMGINDGLSVFFYNDDMWTRIQLFVFDLRVMKLYQWFTRSTGAVMSQKQHVGVGSAIDEDNEQADNELLNRINSLVGQGAYDEAQRLLDQRSASNEPMTDYIQLAQAMVYVESGHADRAVPMYREAVRTRGGADSDVTRLGWALKESGASSQNIDGYLREYTLMNGMLLSVNTSMSQIEATRHHYRFVSQMLQERGITHIAMQYPTLPVSDLFAMDLPASTVIVSQRDSFTLARESHAYRALFTDTITETFGHTTTLGDQIIASRAADVIQAYIDEYGIPVVQN